MSKKSKNWTGLRRVYCAEDGGSVYYVDKMFIVQKCMVQ